MGDFFDDKRWTDESGKEYRMPTAEEAYPAQRAAFIAVMIFVVLFVISVVVIYSLWGYRGWEVAGMIVGIPMIVFFVFIMPILVVRKARQIEREKEIQEEMYRRK